MKSLKRMLTVPLTFAVVLIAIFLAGRYGWTVFALCSPVMAFFAWLTKGRGIFAKIVGVGIVAVSILSSILLFDRLQSVPITEKQGNGYSGIEYSSLLR